MEPRPLSDEEEKKIKNWIILSGYIYSEDISQQELVDFIYYEIHGKQRWQILDRLHSRFNKMRLKEERDELVCLINDVNQKKTPKDTSESNSKKSEDSVESG